MKTSKFFQTFCCATSMILLVSSCGGKKNTNDKGNLQTYPASVVSKQDAELSATYPVTLKGQEDIEIRPRIDGFIDAIYIDEGSSVRKGQSLFKINSPQAEQALTTANAVIKSAEAQVNTAKTNVERIKPLVEKNIVSNIQLITAEDSYQAAMANLAQAEAALKNAQSTMSWTNVASPVDGFVSEIPFRLGSLVNASNVLTTVANTKSVYAYFSLNEKELSTLFRNLEGNTQSEKIKNIPELTLTMADGTIYEHKGKIETITGTVNVTTGSANFRAEFPNPENKLRSGTSGRVTVPKHIDDVIVIPQKATFAQQDKTVVYQVQSDSVVQTIISVLPTPDGKSYVITGGLNEGDKIVTDGIASLYHGKKIATN